MKDMEIVKQKIHGLGIDTKAAEIAESAKRVASAISAEAKRGAAVLAESSKCAASAIGAEAKRDAAILVESSKRAASAIGVEVKRDAAILAAASVAAVDSISENKVIGSVRERLAAELNLFWKSGDLSLSLLYTKSCFT